MVAFYRRALQWHWYSGSCTEGHSSCTWVVVPVQLRAIEVLGWRYSSALQRYCDDSCYTDGYLSGTWVEVPV